ARQAWRSVGPAAPTKELHLLSKCWQHTHADLVLNRIRLKELSSRFPKERQEGRSPDEAPALALRFLGVACPSLVKFGVYPVYTKKRPQGQTCSPQPQLVVSAGVNLDDS